MLFKIIYCKVSQKRAAPYKDLNSFVNQKKRGVLRRGGDTPMHTMLEDPTSIFPEELETFIVSIEKCWVSKVNILFND